MAVFNNGSEMVLTSFQAQVFNDTVQYFKTNGVSGGSIFEDTYVLQKRIVQYIKDNISATAGNTSTFVIQTYNAILGITPAPAAQPNPLSAIVPVSNISQSDVAVSAPATVAAGPVPESPAGPSTSDSPAIASVGNTLTQFFG